MAKIWSFSTTMRNPERIISFLRSLAELEGKPFDETMQEEVLVRLIKNGDYVVSEIPEKLKDIYTRQQDITIREARLLFDYNRHDAKRGRTAVAPLNARGLSVARKSLGDVVITPFGKRLLAGEITIKDFFVQSLLKWQLPNPLEKGTYRANQFNIRPLPAVLELIKKVNNTWQNMKSKPVGISKDEFSLFVPTLTKAENIDLWANWLIEYRLGLRDKNIDNEDLKNNTIEKIGFKIDVELNKQTLRDYSDSCIRNFKLTEMIVVRGNGYYIDLNPVMKYEIDSIINADYLLPLEFATYQEYIEYLGDPLFVVPWHNKYDKIIVQNKKVLSSLDAGNRILSMKANTIKQKQQLIKQIAIEISRLQEHKIHLEYQNAEKALDCIEKLKNIMSSKQKKSIELERLTALGLHIINDAIDIVPNYPKGIDGMPTSHAPAGVADIQSYYSNFNIACEVTMLTDRSQWYNEGQPVMRHLRDFENTTDNQVYCLFVAPKIHGDTLETFWMSSKYGYRGAKQKIIPFTIKQYIELLEIVYNYRFVQNKKFTHKQFKLLLDNIILQQDNYDSSDNWIKTIPNNLIEWSADILKI